MSRETANLFLCSLSSANRNSLFNQCTAVDLPLHTVLFEAGVEPQHAYFLTSGLASVVIPMLSGEAAEIGFIGCEGIVGSLQLLGPTVLSARCMMQLAGTGLRIPFSILQGAFEKSEEVRTRILELVQQHAAVVSQIAGCNRLHSAGQRLTRWLLMAQDQTRSNVLKFTHEYIAEMIGTQRTTVTELAGTLQKRGLICYSRGTIRIEDRAGLEAATCDCYPIIKRMHGNLFSEDGVAVPC